MENSFMASAIQIFWNRGKLRKLKRTMETLMQTYKKWMASIRNMEALTQPFDPGPTMGEFAPAELRKKSSSIPGETPLETSETLPIGPSSSTQESVRELNGEWGT